MKESRQILALFFILFFSLLISFNLNTFLNYDHIWVYGNSLKIAEGLVPYRDFNLVTTPLLYFIVAILLKLISSNIFIFYIVGTVVTCWCYFLCYKIILKITQKPFYSFFLCQLILIYTISNIKMFSYNTLAVLLILSIIYYEMKLIDLAKAVKKENLLIGLLITATVLTKHSVGIVIALMSFLSVLLSQYSFDDKKRIIFYRAISLSLTLGLFLLYLLITNSFWDFIDYTVLGLFSFAGDNNVFSLSAVAYFILPLFILIKCLLILLKNKQPYLRAIYFYALGALVIAYPIFDPFHICIAILPTLIMLPFISPQEKDEKKSWLWLVIILLIYILGKMFIDNSYTRFYNQSKYLSYNLIGLNEDRNITNVNAYIQNQRATGNKVIIVDSSAMVYTLAMEEANYPYNYLLRGNVGANGEQRIIDEFNHLPLNTLFLINASAEDMDLSPPTVKHFIQNNYQYIDSIEQFSVYRRN